MNAAIRSLTRRDGALPRREFPLTPIMPRSRKGGKTSDRLGFLADYTPPAKVPNYENAVSRDARDAGHAIGRKAGWRDGLAAGFVGGAIIALPVFVAAAHLLAGIHS